jgi:hypothetical protein
MLNSTLNKSQRGASAANAQNHLTLVAAQTIAPSEATLSSSSGHNLKSMFAQTDFVPLSMDMRTKYPEIAPASPKKPIFRSVEFAVLVFI